ncbi:hypothetical protein ABBQ38_008217 [Trebouxia sp. C0009 RCD-2024]
MVHPVLVFPEAITDVFHHEFLDVAPCLHHRSVLIGLPQPVPGVHRSFGGILQVPACNRAASSALLMVLTGPGLLGQIVIASGTLSLQVYTAAPALWVSVS